MYPLTQTFSKQDLEVLTQIRIQKNAEDMDELQVKLSLQKFKAR